MDTTLKPQPLCALMDDHDQRLIEIIVRERGDLGNFIRRRVADPSEAEDLLQEVFFELVQAYRLPEPIEQIGAWLFRVARNRIVDRFRKKRETLLLDFSSDGEERSDEHCLDQSLPDPEGGPEAIYARAVLLEGISAALEELPANERDVFVAHELEGESFKEMSARSGIKASTLLGWKRRAVLHLRSRLQPVYDEII